MTAIRPAGLDSFLRKPDPAIGLILIYGEDGGAVRELASRAVQKLAGSLDDPFAVVKLDDGDLSGDPARLADEMQAVSMFGGQKAIWVKDAGDGLFKAAKPVLDGRFGGNIVIAEAGALAKTSGLRQACEDSTHALVLPLYEAEDSDIAAMIDQGLSRDGLAIDADARARLMELAGNSRSLMQREVEKLALYALGRQRVTLADVEASCGGGAEFESDDLIDAVFTGDVADADRILTSLVQGGSDAGRLISAAHSHAQRLADFRLAMEKGAKADMVLRQARPPVFFKRQKTIQRQLAIWPLQALLEAGASLGQAVPQARLNAGLADAIAGRSLLAIANRALKLEREKF